MSGHAHSAAEAALGIAARNALRAPSIFNTQPWRWRIDGGTADLVADRDRALDATDPDGRLLLLSLQALLGGVGTPYLVVRLGYPDPAAGPPPAAPRRAAGEVIDYRER